MNKIITPGSYDFGEPMARLVDFHSRGLDGDWLVKRAAAREFKDFDQLRPAAKHSLIHLIAMGDADDYGANRNGDSFYKTATRLDLIDPNWNELTTADGDRHVKSAKTFADRTHVGNLERHHTFVKFARVFEHHRNKPDQNPDHRILGSVKASAHNDSMRRVELMIEVPNDLWADDLQKLAEGKDVPFSMAANVPYDICSYCGHKAASRKKYCSHLADKITAITKTGHQISAVNDWETFFDISKVRRPADRIAYSLQFQKAASDLRGAELAIALLDDLDTTPLAVLMEGQPAETARRFGYMAKLADIEKKVSAMANGAVNQRLLQLAKGTKGKCEKQAQDVGFYNLPELFTAFADRGVILPVEQFVAFTMGQNKVADMGSAINEAKNQLAHAYSACLQQATDVASNASFDPSSNYPSASFRKIAEDMSEAYGIGPEQVRERAMQATIRGESPTFTKTAASIDVTGLLKNYVAYQLSALDHYVQNNPQAENYALELTVLRNAVQ